MSNAARDERQDPNGCEPAEMIDAESKVATVETPCTSTSKGTRHQSRRRASASAEFSSAFPAGTTCEEAVSRLDRTPQKSVDASLSGMTKIVDEVIEAREGQTDWGGKPQQASDRCSISRQFGKVELFSLDPDEARLSVTQATEVARLQELSCHSSIEQDKALTVDSLPLPIRELLESALGSPVFVCMSSDQLPTMLWTPETHRTILDSIALLESATNGLTKVADKDLLTNLSRTGSERVIGEGAPKPEQTSEKIHLLQPKHQVEATTTLDPIPARSLGEKSASSHLSPKYWGTGSDLMSGYQQREDLSVHRPKLRPTLERPASVREISAQIQNGLITDLVTASKHYRLSEVEKGDALVERALSTVAGSHAGEPNSVMIRPLILASSLNFILNQGDVADPPAATQGLSAPYTPLALLAMNPQLSSMGSAQVSDLIGLTENAALKAADQVLAGNGMFLIKPEATECLAEGLQKLAKNTIESRADGIDRAALESVASVTARDGCTNSLTSLLASCFNNGIESEARQSIKSALQEQPRTNTAAPIPSPASAPQVPAEGNTWGRLPQSDHSAMSKQPIQDDGKIWGRHSSYEKIDGAQVPGSNQEFDPAGNAAANSSQPEPAEREGQPARLSFEPEKSSSDEPRGFPAALSKPEPQQDRSKGEKDCGPVIPLPLGLGLDLRGGGIPRRRAPAGPSQSGRGFTIKMVARSVRGLSRVAELLLSMITHRGSIASLRASCNALKSGAPDLGAHGPFSIKLEHFGKGETAFVVFAENEREAAIIQEQLSSLLCNTAKTPAIISNTNQCAPPVK